MGLQPANTNWDVVEYTYRGHPTIYAFYDGDTIKKTVSIKEDSSFYYEDDCEYQTAESRTVLMPKTNRGKPKKITPSVIGSLKGNGIYVSIRTEDEVASLRIASYATETTFLTISDIKKPADIPQESFLPWVCDRFTETRSEDDIDHVKKFACAKRKRVTYREGDYFRIKLPQLGIEGPIRYTYGRIIMDIRKRQKAGMKYANLMGSLLLVQLFHIATQHKNVSVAELCNLATFPIHQLMDNCIFYGEYELIGNGPLPENPLYPIHYDRTNDITTLNGEKTQNSMLSLCIGETTKLIQEENAVYIPCLPSSKEEDYDHIRVLDDYRNAANGWIPVEVRNQSILDACISQRSNAPYWDYADVHAQDLRNPKNRAKLLQVLNQFGVPEVFTHYDNTDYALVSEPNREIELELRLDEHVDSAGFLYRGQTHNDTAHGRGIALFPHGDVYDGTWAQGMPHGYGVYAYANGDGYIGQISSGKRHGSGACRFVNGGTYIGDWENDVIEGTGTFFYEDKSCYKGQFVHGKRHGIGSCLYANGGSYEGEWKNDNRHGHAVFSPSPSVTIESQWEDDKGIGRGTIEEFLGREKLEGVWIRYRKGLFGGLERRKKLVDPLPIGEYSYGSVTESGLCTLYDNTNPENFEEGVFAFAIKHAPKDPVMLYPDSGFTLKGNMDAVRDTDGINKKAANKAFTRYNNEILGELLVPLGFAKAGTNTWFRINSIGLLEYIDLQKEAHGSKTFTVNIALIPMYAQHDFICIGFGNRIGKLFCDRDVWWSFGNNDEAQTSFQNIAEAIALFVIPWFDTYKSEKAYREKLVEDIESDTVPTYPAKKWLEALDSGARDKHIVCENAFAWNVPKELVDNYLVTIQTQAKADD